MFFDPALWVGQKERKNSLIVGRVINNKTLQIIDGEVWIGAKFEDDVVNQIAELVKEHKPQVVLVEDNIFSKMIKLSFGDYNIPFKGVTREGSELAVIEHAKKDNTIDWQIKKEKDLLFGAGSLLLALQKMNKLVSDKKITESTVVADVEQNLTQNKLFTQRRRKSKKCKKFKEELMKDDA
jgi:hypothetical protein